MKLPVISGSQCIKALQRAGFVVMRQTGRHIVLQKDNPYAMVVVPNHAELDRGTLRSIIRQAGLTIEEFVALL